MAAVNPYLQVEGLTKRIGERTLFEGISFGIAEGQHVGLIAKNGTGKSTLLNIIAGREGHESGTVVFRNGLEVGYLEQDPHYPAALTVIQACFSHGNALTSLISRYEQCMATPGNPGLDALIDSMDRAEAWDYESRAKQILTELHITHYNQVVGTLSGGQLKRVALANVLITRPDLLLLDEPTNHLDLSMIEWLEDYLGRARLSLLMVTHDRYFLDRVCSTILELEDNTLYTYNGNYSYYLEKRQERIDATNAQAAHARNIYRRELEWLRRTPSAREHKSHARVEAFKQIEQNARQRIVQPSPQLIPNSAYIGTKIFEANYITKTFDGTIILKDFYYNFGRYEKMGIVGDNGTGKTTFLKLLLGIEKPDSGHIVVGQTVRFGYYAQEGLRFDPQQKVIDAVRAIAEYIDLGGGRHLTAMQLLQHFLFSPKQQQSYIYKLSGGERRRLYLCTVLMRNPNFLILDEPTNDLDIPTLQTLESYLQTFKGCLIIVSHDRYFMDKVVDHLLVFNGQGIITDFPGNYSQYRMWKQQNRPAPQPKTRAATPSSHNRHAQSSHKLTFRQRREMEQLETDIANLEKEQKQLEADLCSGTLSVAELTEKSKRLPIVTDAIDQKTMRWLELSELEDK